jgi:hypothetical protein
MAVTCEPPPAPLVGGSAESDALAEVAARCGQEDFSWAREGLGEVVGLGDLGFFSADTLETATVAVGARLPEPPQHDVELRVFTYTTQDRGSVLDATALVAYPLGLPAGTTADVILYLHGSSGFNDACAASADEETRLFAGLLASYGYVAVAPDYLGLKNGGEPTGFLNPALVGQPTAVASLDAIRGALRLTQSERGDLCMPTRFATLGGSQGGHAAMWVDRLAPYYARELTPLGTVATVAPADMLGEVSQAVTTLGLSSGSASIFFATGAPWYGYEDRLDEVLEPPQDEAIPERLASGCSRRFTDEFESIDELFTEDIRDAAADGTFGEVVPWGCMLRENGVLTTSVSRLDDERDSYGMLFVTAEEDEIVNTPVERAAFEELCEGGAPIQHLECAGAGHLEGTLWAVGEILEFLTARFADEPFVAGACTASAPVRCSGTPD